jgi:phosphatidylethanolamine/phosphatidyl-N-methylethanolamine N-methyltransferase
LEIGAGRQSRARRGGKHAPPLARLIRDEARFIRTWLDKPLRTGAISPSSPALARAMAMQVDPFRPGPVVELGPGTGPVTEALVERGIAEERLVLLEFDPDFCALLRERFPRARVIQGDAYALRASLAAVLDEPAAAIVSSLPLLTRPEPERIALLQEAFALMAPRAPFIQFTYGLVSPVPREAGGFAARVSPPVWLNLPPARVWTYRTRTRTPPGKRPVRLVRLLGQADQLCDEWLGKVRGEVEGTRDRVRSEIRERTAKVRSELREQADKVVRDRRVQPTLALLRRIGERLEGPDPGRPEP